MKTFRSIKEAIIMAFTILSFSSCFTNIKPSTPTIPAKDSATSIKDNTSDFRSAFLADKLAPMDISTQELIARHIKALGGRQVIENIKTVFEKVEKSESGELLNLNRCVLINKKAHYDGEKNNEKFTEITTPKGSLHIDWKTMELSEYTPEPEILPILLSGLLHYGNPMEILDLDSTNFKPLGITSSFLYKVKHTNSSGIMSYLYIDQKTFLVVRMMSDLDNGEPDVYLTLFSEFTKNKEGYHYPARIFCFTCKNENGRLGETTDYSTTVTDIKYNVPLSDTLFNIREPLKSQYEAKSILHIFSK
ncbi:hypothetical protein SAMN05428988_3141 [Chitinophaga sp. YR573]|uniref:hypothetical protein n=1 Tax=Chitinophaga sp. YR573 TaxID=1881040 RepID=UPI0008CAD7D9|nr:hypothetical protein [Chitinophaga sp. YR573]SEW20857.1 hypothetical protein SAMN05428988_3141 [Chitinophaga sp. YR573]